MAFVIQSLSKSTYVQCIFPVQEQMTVNPRNGRSERIFVNLAAVYPRPTVEGSEMSFEELRASTRGWLKKTWTSEKIEKRTKTKAQKLEVFSDVEESWTDAFNSTLNRNVEEKLIISRDLSAFDENGAVKEGNREGRGRRLKTMEVNETQISKWQLFTAEPY